MQMRSESENRRNQKIQSTLKLNAKRFLSYRQANTGIDIKAGLQEFYQKDTIQSVDKDKQKRSETIDFTPIASRPAIGCTKFSMQYQKSKQNNKFEEKPLFYDSNQQKVTKKLNKSEDFISARNDHDFFNFTQERNSAFQKVNDQIKNKQGQNSIMSIYWEPKKNLNYSLCNAHSVDYDIISFQNSSFKKPLLRPGRSRNANRQPGLSNFMEVTKLCARNENEQFKKIFNTDNNIFKRKLGAFTHMWDSSHRFGNIVKPFEKVDYQDGRKPFI